MKDNGIFIISLDFELLWGVRDKKTTSDYGDHILGVWKALPRMLEAFAAHDVRGTFATVGFLFASDKKKLLAHCPKDKPSYSDANLSPYNGHFELMGETEAEDKYHYATELIELLKKYPNQEIGSHTFSHYYCLESGQEKNSFREDLRAAIAIAEQHGISLESLVFPRNQFNAEYLEILKEVGITSYRGNGRVWFQNLRSESLKRALRLIDSYINISGHNCYTIGDNSNMLPLDIPSSRFLRPYSPKLKAFEQLRLNRILNSMTRAAKSKEIYHLWWHPHNFGTYQEENFAFLDKILDHYVNLRNQYGFESLTMTDITQRMQQHTKNG